MLCPTMFYAFVYEIYKVNVAVIMGQRRYFWMFNKFLLLNIIDC